MAKFINPSYYPIALLAGGIVLVAGVRIWKLPNSVMVPGVALIGTATALYLKSRQPDPEKLARAQVERELADLKASGQKLAMMAGFVRQEAGDILGREVDYLKLLVRIREVCDPLTEIVPKIEELGRRLPRNTAVLALGELEGDSRSARELLSSSTGIARQQTEEFVAGLERDRELAKTGGSLNLAKLVKLHGMVQDGAGLLQELQHKIRTIRRPGSDRAREIEELRERLQTLSRHLNILIR